MAEFGSASGCRGLAFFAPVLVWAGFLSHAGDAVFFSYFCSTIPFPFTRRAAALGSARSLLCAVCAALFAHSGGGRNVSLAVAD